MIHLVLRAGLDFTEREYLAQWGRSLADCFRIVEYESLAARTSFDRGTYVLTALDHLSPGMLRLVEEFHRRLGEAGGIRFLNHPSRTLRRLELLTELRRRNLNEFGAARATDDLTGLRYPVFLRSEWWHSGALSPLLRSPDEVEAAIGRALLYGYAVRDLLVVEFCETADENGFYRKYAAFIVGDRILPRSLAYGHGWMLKHRQTEFSRAVVLEERDYVLGNAHEGQLAEIFRIAGVEYGRIDYAMKDGRVQTWEINLHPTIGRGPHPSSGRVPKELEPIRQESKEHFYRAFAAAWKSVDLPSKERPAVSITLDPGIVGAVRSPRTRHGRLLDLVRSLLRPLKPLLELLARPVLPLLGRLARHRRVRA